MSLAPASRIDVHNIRRHFAARLIVHYCQSSTSKAWIQPIGQVKESLWSYYWGGDPLDDKLAPEQAAHCLYLMVQLWSEDRLQFFSTYAVFRLLARHTVAEQDKILEIIRSYT